MKRMCKCVALCLTLVLTALCILQLPVQAQAAEVENTFDSIRVEFPNYVVYDGSNRPVPLIYDGDTQLKWNKDYTVSYVNYENVTNNAQATVTGLGAYAGFEQTYTYTIVKRDLSDHFLVVENAEYMASPVAPEFTICYEYSGNEYPVGGVTYTAIVEQNVNVGQGFVRAVCTGNSYGAPAGNFEVYLGSTYLELPGHYMGQADGTLDGQTMISEVWLAPGEFTGCVAAEGLNIAYYQLYKIEGEEMTLLKEYESDVNFSAGTTFTYDFSSVYESGKDVGVETYALSYMWVDEYNRVYSGGLAMYVVSQVPAAQTMTLEQIPGDEDFRHEYLTVCSEDGALAKTVWSSSNTDVATVDQGVVTFHKPGTVTITATCGNLTAKQTLTAEANSLEDAAILAWDAQSGTATLMYDYILLQDGIDYTATAKTEGGVITVTAEGKGLFAGQITQLFDAATGRPWEGEIPSDTMAGDFTGDGDVTNEDVVYLLWHTMFPEEYAITIAADFTGDGDVTNEDVVYLLWYTMFPEDFPI